MEKAVTAFGHQIGKATGGKFRMVMAVNMVLSLAMTFIFSFVMAAVLAFVMGVARPFMRAMVIAFVVSVGVFKIGIGFVVKVGLTLTALQVIFVTVLRAARAFIHVFHYDSPYHDDGCGVCVCGVPWDTAVPSLSAVFPAGSRAVPVPRQIKPGKGREFLQQARL